MAEESVVTSSSSVLYMHPMESCLKKILPSTCRSLDPIKTNHWLGKIPRKTKTNSTQMGSLRESCGTDKKEPRHHSVIITCGRSCQCVSPALCVFVLLSGCDPYKIAGLLSVELLCQRSAQIPASEGDKAFYGCFISQR